MRTLPIVVVLALAAGAAHAHDRYTGWQRPDNGQSCCNMIDCKPVQWRYQGSQLWLLLDGQWIEADSSAMLSQPSNDGTAHACWMPGLGRPKPHCIQQPGGAS